jgi:nitrite reductase/ring-hydroxylating ferredoxin subunit/DMSO/TMAO reductase YedYZ heme-binding membrane subunit
MSVGFRAVQWNRDKILYDIILVACVSALIGAIMFAGAQLDPPTDAAGWAGLRLRAFGITAFTMISLILCIGPLARLDSRFLPLLYNRRHFGVLAFCVACAHAFSVANWFYAQDALPDFFNEFVTGANYTKFIGFTTKAIGLAALSIFFVMAATSHDYWLSFLSPPMWKAIHMSVYAAYGLLIMHVSLGLMQHERSVVLPLLLGGSFALVAGLHIAAGWRDRACDAPSPQTSDGWIIVGPPASIPDKRARIVAASRGERIAVFRDGEIISAVTNLCAHQNGPLGEGAVIDGCITCPWHGYQYRLEDGCAPAPFTEKLATYRIRIRSGIVEVDPVALAPGAPAALSLTAVSAV